MKKIISILVLAFVLRIGFILTLEPRPYYPDETVFIQIASNIASGQGYCSNGNPTAGRSPLYPFFLSLIFLISGKSFILVRILQVILSVITVLLIFLVTKNIATEKNAIVSAFISAIYPFFIYYTGYLLLETVFVFLLVLGFYALTIKQNFLSRLFLGVIWGMVILTKGTPVLLVLSICIYFLVKKTRYCWWFILFFLITISPWVVRNYFVFHRIIPFDTHGGHTLAHASIFYDYDKDGILHKAYTETEIGRTGAAMSEIEGDDYFFKQSLNFIKKNPLHMLKLTFYKFIDFWRFYPRPEVKSFTHSKPSLILISLVSNGLIIPLAFLGAIVSFKEWQKFLFVYILILNFQIIHLIFVSMMRYRLPIMPFVIIFAGIGIDFLLKKFSWTHSLSDN